MTTADEPDLTPASEPAETAPLSPGALVHILRAADDLPSEGPVAALPSGELAITMGAKPGMLVTLPRPLFGQMKTLIRAEAALADKLRTVEQRTAAHRNKILEDVKAYQGNAGDGNVELSIENLGGLAAIRDEAREIAALGEDDTEAGLVEFWQLVFVTLMDGTSYDPDRWPADLLDASLPKKAISHWRYAQPGPG